jgi:hypothetical protein
VITHKPVRTGHRSAAGKQENERAPTRAAACKAASCKRAARAAPKRWPKQRLHRLAMHRRLPALLTHERIALGQPAPPTCR